MACWKIIYRDTFTWISYLHSKYYSGLHRLSHLVGLTTVGGRFNNMYLS